MKKKYTTIRLETETCAVLRKLGQKGESYNTIIKKLLEAK